MNAFNLFCMEARFSPLVFTLPLPSISKELNAIRHNFQITIEMWRNFQKETGIEDPEAFLYWLQQQEVGEEYKKLVNYNLLIQRLIHNYFHVSIQSTFDDVKIQDKHIRPDIFIWRPNKPNFKMFIECDGYKYHGNRFAFTADRARDRVLQDKGFQVLRFSGDEINHDCIAKARELRDYLLAREDELFKDEEDDLIILGVAKLSAN